MIYDNDGTWSPTWVLGGGGHKACKVHKEIGDHEKSLLQNSQLVQHVAILACDQRSNKVQITDENKHEADSKCQEVPLPKSEPKCLTSLHLPGLFLRSMAVLESAENGNDVILQPMSSTIQLDVNRPLPQPVRCEGLQEEMQ